ncbi:hypothetical protein JOQ06_023641, partial [Pogonophryne albipinna]
VSFEKLSSHWASPCNNDSLPDLSVAQYDKYHKMFCGGDQREHSEKLNASSLASKGDTDWDSAVANSQIPLEPRQVDSLSRSGGDNKTNYSIMGIIPLFQPQTGVLDAENWLGSDSCQHLQKNSSHQHTA